ARRRHFRHSPCCVEGPPPVAAQREQQSMTWSIIARDKASGAFGIAVATRFFAVGARVPFIAAGIGAVATQALVNPFYGTDGLALLRDGRSADDVVAMLIAADAGRDYRQVHVMDAAGRVAAHTG